MVSGRPLEERRGLQQLTRKAKAGRPEGLCLPHRAKHVAERRAAQFVATLSTRAAAASFRAAVYRQVEAHPAERLAEGRLEAVGCGAPREQLGEGEWVCLDEQACRVGRASGIERVRTGAGFPSASNGRIKMEAATVFVSSSSGCSKM